MHLGRLSISSDWLSILASAQCILLLFRLQYFSRCVHGSDLSTINTPQEVEQLGSQSAACALLQLDGANGRKASSGVAARQTTTCKPHAWHFFPAGCSAPRALLSWTR